jgi:hypothetical protein
MKEPVEGSEVKTKSKRGKRKIGRKKGHQGDDGGDNNVVDGDNGDDGNDDYDDDAEGDGDGDGESSSSSSHVPSLHLAVAAGAAGVGLEMEVDSNLETMIESSNDRIYSDGGDGGAGHSAGEQEQGDSSTPNRKKSRNTSISEE